MKNILIILIILTFFVSLTALAEETDFLIGEYLAVIFRDGAAF